MPELTAAEIRAQELEEKRVDRAEKLARETGELSATQREHTAHLTAINGSIKDLSTSMAATHDELLPLVGAVRNLTTSMDKINEDMERRQTEDRADRKAVQMAVWTFCGALITSGVGAGLLALFT